MVKSSMRKQVVFIKAKRNSALAKAKKRIAAQSDKAKASRDKMVGEPAKPAQPFIVPVPRSQSSGIKWPNLLKSAVVVCGITAMFGAIFFMAGKLRPKTSGDYESPVTLTTRGGSPAQRANASVGYPGSQQGSGESQFSNRAAPTAESFVATYGGLQGANRAASNRSVTGGGSAAQYEGTGRGAVATPQRGEAMQLSSRDTKVEESLFAPYDGSQKPVYLPNLSGSCNIKGAGVNAFGECLRQQLRGSAKDK